MQEILDLSLDSSKTSICCLLCFFFRRCSMLGGWHFSWDQKIHRFGFFHQQTFCCLTGTIESFRSRGKSWENPQIWRANSIHPYPPPVPCSIHFPYEIRLGGCWGWVNLQNLTVLLTNFDPTFWKLLGPFEFWRCLIEAVRIHQWNMVRIIRFLRLPCYPCFLSKWYVGFFNNKHIRKRGYVRRYFVFVICYLHFGRSETFRP